MSNPEKLTEQVKSFALREGAERVGIASVDRFEGAPKDHKPTDLMPTAKYVISMGMRKPAFIMESMPRYPHYPTFGYHLINDLLKYLAYRVAVLLEEEGYRALPVTPTGELNTIKIISEGEKPEMKMMGVFSQRHAAVAAGLGEIGLNSLLLDSKLGPRIRLVSVITEAPLEADPLLEKRICQPERCGEACLKACPPRALVGKGVVEHYTCRYYRSKEANLDYWKKMAELPILDRATFYSETALSGSATGPGGLVCALCIKSCPIGFLPSWDGYPAEKDDIKEKTVKIPGLQ